MHHLFHVTLLIVFFLQSLHIPVPVMYHNSKNFLMLQYASFFLFYKAHYFSSLKPLQSSSHYVSQANKTANHSVLINCKNPAYSKLYQEFLRLQQENHALTTERDSYL